MIQPERVKMNRVLLLVAHKEEKSKLPDIIARRIREQGFSCDIKNFKDLEIMFGDGKRAELTIGGRDLSEYKSVFIRTIGKSQINKELASILVRECRKRKIRVFDDLYRHYINENKLVSGYVLNENKILVPLTYYCGSLDSKNMSKINKTIGFPLIIKKTDSAKGKAVFLIKNSPELSKFASEYELTDYIIQKLIPNTNDWRVYLTSDGKGFAITRRRTSDSEITNNISRGGTREYANLSKTMRRISVKASRALGINFAGVDFITVGRRHYMLEVNRAPSYTGMDKNGKRAFDFVGEYAVTGLKKGRKHGKK